MFHDLLDICVCSMLVTRLSIALILMFWFRIVHSNSFQLDGRHVNTNLSSLGPEFISDNVALACTTCNQHVFCVCTPCCANQVAQQVNNSNVIILHYNVHEKAINGFHAYRNSKCFKFLGGYCTIPELWDCQPPVCNPGKPSA